MRSREESGEVEAGEKRQRLEMIYTEEPAIQLTSPNTYNINTMFAKNLAARRNMRNELINQPVSEVMIRVHQPQADQYKCSDAYVFLRNSDKNQSQQPNPYTCLAYAMHCDENFRNRFCASEIQSLTLKLFDANYEFTLQEKLEFRLPSFTPDGVPKTEKTSTVARLC